MADEKLEDKELSLDPNNRQGFKNLGFQMIKDMTTYFSTIRKRPVWQPVPNHVKKQLQEELPLRLHRILQQILLLCLQMKIHGRIFQLKPCMVV